MAEREPRYEVGPVPERAGGTSRGSAPGSSVAYGGVEGAGRPTAGWARPEAGLHVRALRAHLGETQSAFADRLGTNQQTVSEWERGARRPRRMAQRLLHLVAEQAAFYRTDANIFPVDAAPQLDPAATGPERDAASDGAERDAASEAGAG